MIRSCLLLSGVWLAISGCTPFSARQTTCSIAVEQKKTILGDESAATTCNCTCPAQKSSVVDGLGILGGLANLWSTND